MNRQGPGKVEWERFDRYGGYNPRGKNWALIINGIEIFDFWNNGLVTPPIGSPALILGCKGKKCPSHKSEPCWREFPRVKT